MQCMKARGGSRGVIPNIYLGALAGGGEWGEVPGSPLIKDQKNFEIYGRELK